MKSLPPFIAGAVRLNGIIWLSIALLFLSAALTGGDLGYALLMLAVAGVGTLVNLGLSLWKYVMDRQQALPYFIGAALLALLSWWYCYGLAHIDKMSG